MLRVKGSFLRHLFRVLHKAIRNRLRIHKSSIGGMRVYGSGFGANFLPVLTYDDSNCKPMCIVSSSKFSAPAMLALLTVVPDVWVILPVQYPVGTEGERLGSYGVYTTPPPPPPPKKKKKKE